MSVPNATPNPADAGGKPAAQPQDDANASAAAAAAAEEAAKAAAEAAAKAAAGLPAPAAFVEPAKPEVPDGTVEVEYSPTGDAGLDLALTFIGRLGLGPEREDMKAAQAGDFTKIEATLKELGDKAKGYQPYLNAAKDSYKRRAADAQKSQEALSATVAKAVGGVEVWNAVHAWVSAEASPEQKAEINAAMKAGEFSATAMARQLAELYKQSGASNAAPKSAVQPNASAMPASGTALSPEQFKAEMRRLEAKYGYRLENTDEYKQAWARRLAFKR